MQYELRGVHIESVNEVADLGILVGTDHYSNLNFSKHCVKIAKEASARSALMFRAFSNRNIQFRLQLYKTFVRPKLEYASPAWNPYLKKDINVLESVQRAFTLRLNSYQLQGQYLQRLERFNLETLESRRLMIDLQYVYRIVHGLIDLDFNELFTRSPRQTEGSECKIFLPGLKKNLNCRKYSFAIRTINVWNFLSKETRLASSLDKKFETVTCRVFCFFKAVQDP